MKKFLIITFSLVILTFIIFKIIDNNYFKYKAPQQGDVSKWQMNLKNNEAYELALDNMGIPIFKDPNKAFKQLKKDYKKALKTIKKLYNISFSLNKYNYEAYKNLGWQTLTYDNEICDECWKVTQILDFFDNSIRK